MDVGEVTRTAVIINPLSGRGRGKGLALAEKLASTRAVDLTIMQSFDDLAPALKRAASADVERLFISSGDGTVHAIQTWLAENLPAGKLPQLCLLPHGTTNMTAADLGYRDKNISNQAHFILNGLPDVVAPRCTVKILNPKSGTPLHGMFFGTGAISEATRYCQQVFNDNGIGGNFATFATLASATAKTIFSKPNLDDVNRFDRPHDIALRIDSRLIGHGRQLLMLATTLNKLILNSKPFWGGGGRPLRTTLMPYPIPSPLRWLIPSLFGGESRTPPPGAFSMACSACEVTSDTEFVIDGEFYQAPEHEPLRIEAGPQFQYILT